MILWRAQWRGVMLVRFDAVAGIEAEVRLDAVVRLGAVAWLDTVALMLW